MVQNAPGTDVVIVDPNPVVAQFGLPKLLATKGLRAKPVSPTLGDVETVAKKVLALEPKLVLMEARLFTMDAFDLLEKLVELNPEIRVMFVTAFDNNTYVARALSGGAKWYCLKSATTSRIADVAFAASTGEEVTLADGVEAVRKSMQKQSPIDAAREANLQEGSIPLTQRELQVARHVGYGLSNKEIGRTLNISVETVKEHVQNMLRKLEVSDRTQAAVLMVRKGLLA